jgi:hypothetical protein
MIAATLLSSSKSIHFYFFLLVSHRWAFGIFDVNGDGSVSTDEIKAVMADLGQQIDDGEVRATSWICDTPLLFKQCVDCIETCIIAQ